MGRVGVFVTLLACASPAGAQRIERETPKGERLTVPIGGVLWEKAAFNGAPGVIIAAPVTARFKMGQVVDLPAGTPLMIIRAKKLKACQDRVVTRLGGYGFDGWTNCLIDTNGDGTFDRVALNEVAGADDIVPPVAYTKEAVSVAGAGSASFKQTLTFLGVAAGSLRLSYREYANDLARPAFTEELTVPTPAALPAPIHIKSVKLNVLSIDGTGLTYTVN